MRRIIFLLSIFIFAVSTHAKVYLVCAGVSDYPGTKNDLKLPAKDAKTFHDLCLLNKMATSILLLDKQATSSNIIKEMEKLYSKAGAEDEVIFYFSGHGYPGGFVAYDGSLPYSKVRAAMSKGKSKHKMIFADACFSGKIRENKKSSSTEDNDAKKADVMLFLSSRGNEKSYERWGMKNGMYTTYLSQGLKGSADTNHDRIITAKELFDYVNKNVSTVSRGKQHPVMWGKFSDNMPIMKW
ncbi:MAG: caspase family protein [Prevotella sp.]|nr:caspase family protein [Bacteroides sp.]MCM1366426.1 caspase family protein [Prevotella sp.]